MYTPSQNELDKLNFRPTTALNINTDDIEWDVWISPDFWPYNIIHQEFEEKWYFFDDNYRYTREVNVTSKEDIETLIRLFSKP